MTARWQWTVCLMATLATSSVSALDGAAWERAARRLPSFDWQPPQTVPLDGAVLHLRTFHVIPLNPADTAERLQAAWPVLAHALFSTRWVVLSGLVERGSQPAPCQSGVQTAHWLAELYPEPDGTRGRLSVLCLDEPLVVGGVAPAQEGP